MNCRETESRLQSFLDGDLDAPQSRRVRAHLSQCPRCAALKRDFESLTQIAKEIPTAGTPGDFEGRLRHQIAVRQNRRPLWTRRGAPLTWGAAAAAVAVLVVSTLFFPGYNRSKLLPAARPAAARVSPVVLPGESGVSHMHALVPDEQESVLVRVPTTVTITRQQLNQDFFLSEVSH